MSPINNLSRQLVWALQWNDLKQGTLGERASFAMHVMNLNNDSVRPVEGSGDGDPSIVWAEMQTMVLRPS